MINWAIRVRLSEQEHFQMVVGSLPDTELFFDFFFRPINRAPIPQTGTLSLILAFLRLPEHAIADLARDWYLDRLTSNAFVKQFESYAPMQRFSIRNFTNLER